MNKIDGYEQNRIDAADLTRVLVEHGKIPNIDQNSDVRPATTFEDQSENTDCVITMPGDKIIRVGYRTYENDKYDFTIAVENEGFDTELRKIRRGHCPHIYVIDRKPTNSYGLHINKVRCDIIVMNSHEMRRRGYFSEDSQGHWRFVRVDVRKSFMAISFEKLHDEGLFIFSYSYETKRP